MPVNRFGDVVVACRRGRTAATPLRCVLLCCALLCANVAVAAPPEWMGLEAVASADEEALLEDIRMFTRVGAGIALSLAACKRDELACIPTVDRDELRQLKEALEQRISELLLRWQDGGDATLDATLLAYANSRDLYSGYIDQLSELPTFEETEFFEQDIFSDEGEELFDDEDVFSDADDLLEDDTDWGGDFDAGAVGEEELVPDDG